jgi:hypothetical protein
MVGNLAVMLEIWSADLMVAVMVAMTDEMMVASMVSKLVVY